MPDTFHGYKTDLLVAIKNMGRSIVGDDDLFEAAQEYTAPGRGGGTLGPALLAKDCNISVTTLARDAVNTPDVSDAPADPEVEAEDPWEDYTLMDLRDLMKANNIDVPRALSYGKAIAALDDHGVQPAK